MGTQFIHGPTDLQQAELERMNTVMGNFRIYKAIEVILAIAGLLLTFFFRDQLFWYAFGVGLLAQAGIMLVLDLMAEQRGEVYKYAVNSL